jgi:hypothetical protein
MTNQPNPNRQKMIDLRNQGLSYGSIAKLVKLSRARVHQICTTYNSPKWHARTYQKIHNSILVRDNFKCQWGNVCKNKNVEIKDLVVHHIDFNDRNNEPNNLITLCRFCHAGFHATNHINKKILKNLKPKRIIKICSLCGKKFWIRGNNRKTCSDKCLIKKYPNCYNNNSGYVKNRLSS